MEIERISGSKKKSYEHLQNHSQLFHILYTVCSHGNVHNPVMVKGRSFFLLYMGRTDRLSAGTELLADNVNVVLKLGIIILQLFPYFVVTADDGRVIPVAQEDANILIGSVGDVPAQIHDNLSGNYDICISLASDDIPYRDPEVFRHHFQDDLGRDDPLVARRDDVFEHFFCQSNIDLPVFQIG